MRNEPLEVTLKVTRVFENLGVPYCISGSLASTLYGMVRLTQDADIVAEMKYEPAQLLGPMRVPYTFQTSKLIWPCGSPRWVTTPLVTGEHD